MLTLTSLCLLLLQLLGPSGKETDSPVTFEALYQVGAQLVQKQDRLTFHLSLPPSLPPSPPSLPCSLPSSPLSLLQEFNSRYAEPYRIMKFSSRRVTRCYAFELPDVPQESEYLQVQYSAEYQAPPHNASGRTFSRVFGTTSSRQAAVCVCVCVCVGGQSLSPSSCSLEHLIISRQLKGPCWLHISQPSERRRGEGEREGGKKEGGGEGEGEGGSRGGHNPHCPPLQSALRSQ